MKTSTRIVAVFLALCLITETVPAHALPASTLPPTTRTFFCDQALAEPVAAMNGLAKQRESRLVSAILVDGKTHDAFNAEIRPIITQIGRELGLTPSAAGEYPIRKFLRNNRAFGIDHAYGNGDSLLWIEPDGLLVIIDPRFNAWSETDGEEGLHHAGRNRFAVYAGSLRKAKHEAAELRATTLWALNHGKGEKLVTVAQILSGQLGDRVHSYINGFAKSELREMFDAMTRRFMSFHRKGEAAEGENDFPPPILILVLSNAQEAEFSSARGERRMETKADQLIRGVPEKRPEQALRPLVFRQSLLPTPSRRTENGQYPLFRAGQEERLVVRKYGAPPLGQSSSIDARPLRSRLVYELGHFLNTSSAQPAQLHVEDERLFLITDYLPYSIDSSIPNSWEAFLYLGNQKSLHLYHDIAHFFAKSFIEADLFRIFALWSVDSNDPHAMRMRDLEKGTPIELVDAGFGLKTTEDLYGVERIYLELRKELFMRYAGSLIEAIVSLTDEDIVELTTKIWGFSSETRLFLNDHLPAQIDMFFTTMAHEHERNSQIELIRRRTLFREVFGAA